MVATAVVTKTMARFQQMMLIKTKNKPYTQTMLIASPTV
jgi:hypothetical protein